MNYYDPEKAAQVWQRVQGGSDTVAVGLQGLLMQAVANERTYTALDRYRGGFPAKMLSKCPPKSGFLRIPVF